MADEKSIGSINKMDVEDSSFHQLLAEGIHLLQDFSSELWTDYNEHDPGLTILENLLYALTEVNNKTTLPIKDLVLKSESQRIRSGDNAFYTAPEICTMNPLTETDYRKLIIDRVTNVKNVFVESAADSSSPHSLSGLYNFYVELFVYLSDADKQEEETQRVIRAIRTIYAENRNLCENINSIVVFKPYALEMQFNIELNPKSEGAETIMTHIIGLVNNWLSPSVNFYTLPELVDQGVSIEEAYQGPLTKNGFIRDCDLPKRRTELKLSEIIKKLAQISGVQSVSYFRLLSNEAELLDQNTDDTKIVIPTGYTPLLLFPKERKNLVFKNGNLALEPNLQQVKNQLAYLQSLDFSKDKKLVSDEAIAIPKGSYQEVKNFSTVRDQFPNVYGIGPNGLPVNASKKRRAQAKQLQAFLLPFEQLMANCAEQLHQLYTLYDISDDNTQSYFSQVMSAMDEVIDLVGNAHNPVRTRDHWQATIKQLNKRHDPYALKRLNQVANDLLMRFGEVFDSYALRKINAHTYQDDDKDFERIELQEKRKLLRNYASLSYQRARAANYASDNDSQAGLLKKLGILLGIADTCERNLTEVVSNSRIQIYERNDGSNFISEQLKPLLSQHENGFLIAEQFVFIDQSAENLENAIFFLGRADTILKDVLKNGVERERYKIKVAEGLRIPKYYIIYTENKKEWLIHISYSRQEAIEEIEDTIAYLSELNRTSEGLILLERPLLAPPFEENNFGFRYQMKNLNQELDFNLVQTQALDLSTRNKYVNAIFDLCMGQYQGAVWELEIRSEHTGYRLVVNVQGVDFAQSENTNSDRDEVEKWKNLLLHLNASTRSETPFQAQFLAYYGPNAVDEKDLSMKMNLILPDWPARFQDPNFQKLVENMVYEQSPMACVTACDFISFEDMKAFEKIYFAWTKLMRANTNTPELLNKKYELLCFLKYLEVKKENGIT